MWFKYKGFDVDGNSKVGEIEGVDEEDVIFHLRSKKIFGVNLEQIKMDDKSFNICDVKTAPKDDIKTKSRKDIIEMRYNYEDLRGLLRSILLDVGITEDILRNLILDLKSDDALKQKKVIEFIESMGFYKEALELSKAFLFKTDFNNTQNPEDFS